MMTYVRYRFVVPLILLFLGGSLLPSSSLRAQDETTEEFTAPLPSDGGGKYPEIQDAVTRFRNGDFGGARQILESAKSRYAELPSVNVMMAQLFLAAKELSLGRATLEQSIKDDPADAEPYVLFGELAVSERRITDADQLFLRAYSLVKKMSGERTKGLQKRILSGLASVKEARQEWSESEKLLRLAADIDSTDAKIQTRLARALVKLNRDADAYRLLGQVHQQNPDSTRPEITMAMLYLQDGKDESRQTQLVNNAIQADPNGLRTRLEAANWALESGNASLARTHTKKALEIDPQSLQAKLLDGLAARYENDLGGAEAAFTRAHLQAPIDFNAMNNLALTLVEQLDDAKRRLALQYAQLCRQTYSDLSQAGGREAAVTYAWVLFRLGEEAKAEAALQNMSRLWGAVTPESAYHGARIFHARGKPQAALQILQPALQKRGSFAGRAEAEELLSRLRATS